MRKPIGTVTHYYDRPHAAAVTLREPLERGETVTFDRGATHFSQAADSLQIDHTPVDHAEAGDVIGIQVGERLKPGTEVYRGDAA